MYTKKNIIKIRNSTSDHSTSFDFEVVGHNMLLCMCTLTGIDDNELSLHVNEWATGKFYYVNPLEDQWVRDKLLTDRYDVTFTFIINTTGCDVEITLIKGETKTQIAYIKSNNFGGYYQELLTGIPISPSYIVGPPKSGTTLVELILNSHPNCLSLGEANLTLLNKDISKELVEACDTNAYFTPVNNMLNGVRKLDYMQYGVEQVWRLNIVRKLMHVGKVSMVFDKDPYYQYILNRITDFHSKVVFCIRNPLDILISRAHHEAKLFLDGGKINSNFSNLRNHSNRLNETELADYLIGQPRFVGNVIQEFKDYLSIFNRFKNTPSAYAFSFESFIDNPKYEIEMLLKFANLDYTDHLVNKILIETSFDNLSKNIVKQNIGIGFFRSGKKDQYIERLPLETKNYIEMVLREYFDA